MTELICIISAMVLVAIVGVPLVVMIDRTKKQMESEDEDGES